MKTALFFLLTFLAGIIHAEEPRIYQQDKYGKIQYHKPSYTLQKDGKIIETDTYGKKQYHKPSYSVQKDGRVIEADRYGNRQHHKQQHLLTNDQVSPIIKKGDIQR